MNTFLTDAIIEKIEELSLDDVLRTLIADTDLIEVACCLDFIAKESGRSIKLYYGEDREYPA